MSVAADVTEGSLKARLSYDEIKDFLPHRAPALLITAAEVDVENMSVNAWMNVAAASAMCDGGHFPERSIVMGALTLEAVQQAAALLALYVDWHESDDRGNWKAPLVLAREVSACFNGIVKPSDQVTIEVKLQYRERRYAFFTGCAKVGEKEVVSVTKLQGSSLRAMKS